MVLLRLDFTYWFEPSSQYLGGGGQWVYNKASADLQNPQNVVFLLKKQLVSAGIKYPHWSITMFIGNEMFMEQFGMLVKEWMNLVRDEGTESVKGS